MSWIQTFTGKQIYPLEPEKVEDCICIEDIAHALSMICRFVGHCEEFYSVAEHSVYVSRCMGGNIYALLHDAAEAYLGDISRPMKTDEQKKLEKKLLSAIFAALGLPEPPEAMKREIKYWDDTLLATEAESQLRGGPIRNWTQYFPTAIKRKIRRLSPKRAKKLFFKEWKKLGREVPLSERSWLVRTWERLIGRFNGDRKPTVVH